MKKRFLALAMAAMMVVSLAACGGGNSKPTTTPATTNTPAPTQDPTKMTFTQAPSIKSTVAVTDRIPVAADVYVEQVDAHGATLEIGQYGGTINLNYAGKSNAWDICRPMLESIIRFNADGSFTMNVIKEATASADKKVWTFKLREGMKWSDGQPFTADDIVFWYNTIHKTNFDSQASWSALLDSETGNPCVVTKVDDYTVTWTFENPKYSIDFIENGNFKWCWAPKHFWLGNGLIAASVDPSVSTLSDEEVLANAAKLGFEYSDIASFGKQLAYKSWNGAGIPQLNAWVLTTQSGLNNPTGERCLLIRNEYYWKVDANGQQLPYCDEIQFRKLGDNAEQALLEGSLDLMDVDMAKVTTLETQAAGKLQRIIWSGTSFGGTQLTFNYTSENSKYAELFNNIAFREAMSICVDRTTVAALLSKNMLDGGQAAPAVGAFGYDAEWSTKWTEYDKDNVKAKSLLESCGLKMGNDGLYHFADGSELVIDFLSYVTSGAADAYPVLEQYFTALGIKTTFSELEQDTYDLQIRNNNWVACINPHTALSGMNMKDRVQPFVPIQQKAEWQGNFGTYYETKGESGTKPTGDMAKLVELYEQWAKATDGASKDKINLEVYKILKDNMWTIAYVESAPTYVLANVSIHNYPNNLTSCDLYQYSNIVHFEAIFKK